MAKVEETNKTIQMNWNLIKFGRRISRTAKFIKLRNRRYSFKW